MKKLLFSAALLVSAFSYSQVGIGTTNPNVSAALDVTSTTQGLLPPRMTYIQRNIITTPAAGLQVWCSDCGANGEMQVFNGAIWINMIGNSASFLKPDAPTSPIATAGNAQASIAFIAPVFNGGGTITGYTVTASPSGLTTTGSTSPLVVSGLTNGTYYTFTVVATNAMGNSSASSASAAVIPVTGNAICDGSVPTVIVEITSTTGVIWMDRNLGASRAAISETDFMAYGCLFQWGRGNDGHASITWTTSTSGSPVNSNVSTTLATTDVPGNLFIKVTTTPFDWRSNNNNLRWNSTVQVNNPCPTGFHVPTKTQLDAEFMAYSISDSASAYINGPGNGFKYVRAGFRNSSALISDSGISGSYWNSSVGTTASGTRYIGSTSSSNATTTRVTGASVRCIKD